MKRMLPRPILVLLLACAMCTSLPGCAKIQAHMPAYLKPAPVVPLPATGITAIESVTVTAGDTKSLKEKTRIEKWFSRIWDKKPQTPPPGAVYTLQAHARLSYSKEQLHSLLACKAAAFQRDQHFTSGREEAFDYAPDKAADRAVGTLLMRYQRETGVTPPPSSRAECMAAPREALPTTAVSPVATQTLSAPVPQPAR